MWWRVCKRNMSMQEEQGEGGPPAQQTLACQHVNELEWSHHTPQKMPIKASNQSQSSSIEMFFYFFYCRHMNFRGCIHPGNLSDVAFFLHEWKVFHGQLFRLTAFYRKKPKKMGILLTSSEKSMTCSMVPPVRVLVLKKRHRQRKRLFSENSFLKKFFFIFGFLLDMAEWALRDLLWCCHSAPSWGRLEVEKHNQPSLLPL